MNQYALMVIGNASTVLDQAAFDSINTGLLLRLVRHMHAQWHTCHVTFQANITGTTLWSFTGVSAANGTFMPFNTSCVQYVGVACPDVCAYQCAAMVQYETSQQNAVFYQVISVNWGLMHISHMCGRSQ